MIGEYTNIINNMHILFISSAVLGKEKILLYIYN